MVVIFQVGFHSHRIHADKLTLKIFIDFFFGCAAELVLIAFMQGQPYPLVFGRLMVIFEVMIIREFRTINIVRSLIPVICMVISLFAIVTFSGEWDDDVFLCRIFVHGRI